MMKVETNEAYKPAPRSPGEIAEAASELDDKVWCNRQRLLIQRGKVKKGDPRVVAIEDQYGPENIYGNDFKWGMLCGKLSAIRWVMGSEWDDLDA